MTSPNPPGRSEPHRLRPLAEELGVLLFIVLAALAPDLITGAFGSPTVARLLGLVLITAPFACLWGFAKVDPAGFLSIAAPVVLLGAVAFVTAWDPPVYVGTILFLAWAIAGSRIWPWWSREVLRRMRRGTPEAEVVAASRRIFALWGSPMSQESYATITKEIQDLDRLSTPRTIAYVTGLQAAWDFMPGAAVDDRGKRMSARLAEEYDRLWRGPQVSLRGGNRALAFRPSRGTRLEFRFPRLEALVAIGTAAEHSEMAGRAAARALHEVGIVSPELDRSLREVSVGHEQPEARREVDERLQAVLDELLPMYDHPDHDADRGLQLAQLANALSSAQSALAPDLSPREVADAVYSAITADLPDEDESAYDALLTAIVGTERAAKAVAVEAIPRKTTDGQDSESGSFVGPMLALIARSSATRRGLVALAGVGIVAGVVGTFIRQGLRPLSDGLAGPVGVDQIVGALAVGLVAYALLRFRSGRPGFYDFLILVILAVVAQALLGPLFTASENLLSPLNPDAWTSLFYDNPWGAIPYSPWHGLLFAAVLVVAALVVRRSTSHSDQARP